MSNVLVIGDAHVDSDQQANGEMDRFDFLSRKIQAFDYDHVVIIGDFMSMHSLSHWDADKPGEMEGRRYRKDMDAGREALETLANAANRKTKPPELHYIEGNHEAWLDSFLAKNPILKGHMSISQDLKLEELGFTSYTPYKQVLDIDGVSFTHVPITGNGRPISNPNPCRKALQLYHNSVVFGHLHTLDHGAEHKHGAPHLNQALSVGCFFYHIDEYAKGSKTDYWRGVVDLNIYHANRFDLATTSLSNLRRYFGG